MNKIFISYRRQDGPGMAGRIFDKLTERFGHDAVFMDVEGIPPGSDFRQHITSRIDEAKVLLALIGSNWLRASGPKGRLDDQNDFVRKELEAAFERGVPVIPGLLGNTPMPRAEDLPNSIARLAYLNPTRVNDGADFQRHIERLMLELEVRLGVLSPPERIRAVAEAQTENLSELLRIAKLDPTQHLRFQEWSHSSFRDNDLRGCDFTGGRLLSCDFKEALIAGARFDLAEIDRVGWDAGPRTNLRAAKDWVDFAKNWKRAEKPVSDRHLDVGAVFQDAPFGPEMVVVPPGSFVMGSPEDEPERSRNDSPQHEVTIGDPVAVGRYAVTFEEWDFAQDDHDWQRITGVKPHKPEDHGWGRGDRPVINVNWEDAQAYVKWLRDKTGKAYRLLSEAEWEYVARAGTTSPFWWGDGFTPDQANYNGNYTYKGGGKKGKYRQKTLPVRSFEPNPWGLYQVHGNVYEWCEDVWHDNYNGAPDDGGAWNDDRSSSRVLRGGSWVDIPEFCRSAYRSRISAGSRGIGIGFRLARTLTY